MKTRKKNKNEEDKCLLPTKQDVIYTQTLALHDYILHLNISFNVVKVHIQDP